LNTKEAIDFLRKCGYTVNRYNKVYLVSYGTQREPCRLSPRELIKRAKVISSEVRRGIGSLKHFEHRNNRSATRQDIKRELWDNFDKNKLRKRDNPWNWG